MKRVLNILCAALLTANIFGQATQTMSYLAMFRIINNDLLTSSSFTSEPSTSVESHYVGEFFGGGIVFYVDDEGKHGIITTIIDKNTRKQYKSETFILTSAVRDGIAAGKFNTDRLNETIGTESTDDQVGENFRDANLGDWHLPTRYDLIKLYRNRAVIGGYTEFALGWKSTEVSSVNEWYRSFITGGEFSNGKDDGVYIRVIRKF